MDSIKKKVSIVTPFYNESAGVELFYKELLLVLKEINDVDFEIIGVDDGSVDSTLMKLTCLADKDVRFCVIELSRNFGKEAALTAGIDCASGDAAIFIDSDLQDPPQLISEMINAWLQGADIVLARRVDRRSDTILKRKTAAFFYYLYNKLSSNPIPPNVGDFRLMDRKAYSALRGLHERNRFMKGLFAWVGFKTVTLDYVRNARATGRSKFSGWRLWNFALDGITSFSAAPLKFWSYIGAIIALSTFLYAIFIILRTIIYGVDVPGYASLLVAILFIGSLQLIGIGILGEYIGRIYIETKNRPLYLVRKYYGANKKLPN